MQKVEKFQKKEGIEAFGVSFFHYSPLWVRLKILEIYFHWVFFYN